MKLVGQVLLQISNFQVSFPHISETVMIIVISSERGGEIRSTSEILNTTEAQKNGSRENG